MREKKMRGWKINFCYLIVAATLASAGQLPAQEFKGAAAILQQVTPTAAKPAPEKKDPQQSLRDKLSTFQSQVTNLAPADAARQWLGLVEEFQKASTPAAYIGRQPGMPKRITFRDLMNVLPPPATWRDLESAVDATPAPKGLAAEKSQLGMRLIVHTLTSNNAKRDADLKALGALSRKGSEEDRYYYPSLFSALNEAILSTLADSDSALRLLENELTSDGMREVPLRIPNLVAIAGPEKTEAFLRKALRSSRQIEIEPDTPTHKLASKIALEMIDEMPVAQWSLVNSLDSVKLYEALDRKFNSASTNTAIASTNTLLLPIDNVRSFTRNDTQAKLYYFLGLIAVGRVPDAIKIASDFDHKRTVYFPSGLIKEMERAGLTQQLNSFFETLLNRNPEAPFWREYLSVAAHAGHSENAIALLRATLQKDDLEPSRRKELQALMPDGLLANDELEAGIAELMRSLTNASLQSVGGQHSGSVVFFEESVDAVPIKVATIGKLVSRKEWLDEGIDAAKKRLKERPPVSEEMGSFGSDLAFELADLLSDLGRGAEAEEILGQELAKNNSAAGTKQRRRSYGREAELSREGLILLELLKVYSKAGRYADVVWLLDNADNWGVGDLVRLQSSHGDYRSPAPFVYYAAVALAKTGRAAEAGRILNYLLEQSPGNDRAYELLLQLDSTNPVPRLDALFALDRFEERPLIWKAHWLRTQGKLAEAETAARQAIAIDPSDGEQGRGDRMRAYAELAEIRAARGDQKEAEFLRGAVAAIREAELADQFHSAGLLRRAVKMYEDSLNHFADAYCIQSRLAVQLADLGLHEEAEKHYRRAYELMPESFGRVESHCFGCERAFEGERAQGMAEKVFTQLAEKTPNKPQVHYLLGYLREEQDRPREALQHYRQAVKLDPDYLNAWNKISLLGAKTTMPAADRDEAIFNILRLDPRGRHAHNNFAPVSDLSTLWQKMDEQKGKLAAIKPPASLYPLAASAKKLAAKAPSNAADEETSDEMVVNDYREYQNQPDSPAAAVSQNSYLVVAGRLLGNWPSGFD